MNTKNLIAIIISFLLLINIANAEEYYVSNHLHAGGIINTDIVSSQDSFYEYEMIGIYDAYFNDNPTQAQVVKFILSGTEITFQPMALNWRNDISQLQQINMIQGVTGTPENNIFSYDNAYGSGIHLTYVTEEAQIKERLWINNFSDLTSPHQYIIDGGNAYLELNFIISTNAQHIEIDGVEWDKDSDKSTTNPVYIKDDNGKILYYLPKPIAVDDNSDKINLTYYFKKSGSSLYISIGTPYSWLQNASYPIFIDPTFVADYTPNPAIHLYRGDVGTDGDSVFDSTPDITTHMSDNLTNISYVTIDSGNVGQAISGSWTQTYNNESKWFLRIYKTSMGNSGTPYAYAYNDTNNLSNNYTTYSSPVGIGWYNYPVDNQMSYQKNVLGLNYTKLRFYTGSTGSWAEMRLRQEYNDTNPPITHNCWAENSTTNCSGTTIWYCNITDDLDVDRATFTIDGTNYSAIQNDPLWYYTMNFNDTITINETITLTDVYAYDIFNQSNHTNFNVSTQHDCYIFVNCTENWLPQYEACLTNDTQLKTYTDNNTCGTNITLPIDNGTYTGCDYCIEDLEATIGECTSNSTQNVTYTDYNYTTCCLITNQTSDCSITFYPYNETTTQSCTYYTNDFNCTYDSTPVLNDKINVVCELPDNQTYCCVINIFQNEYLLATTPEYQDATDSLLSLRSEEETRICFTPQSRLLNAYYTKKELRPNTNYVMEVLCTTISGTSIRSQAQINPEYHEYDWLPHRIISIGDKPVLTILTIIAIILLFLLAILGLKKLRGR